MLFRLAASVVTLGMLVASALASYAAITMISGESTRAGPSVGRLATPLAIPGGGDGAFVAPTPAVTPSSLPATVVSPTPAR